MVILMGFSWEEEKWTESEFCILKIQYIEG